MHMWCELTVIFYYIVASQLYIILILLIDIFKLSRLQKHIINLKGVEKNKIIRGWGVRRIIGERKRTGSQKEGRAFKKGKIVQNET